MARQRYWSGFAAGAVTVVAAGASALAAADLIGRAHNRRVVRLQKSIQIGRPIEEVFRAWANLETVPRMSHTVRDVRRQGNRSHWVVNFDGKQFEWDAQIEQFIPNQAIGWKSVTGPKHTGRISFSPLGNDTMVHVTMNYAPRLRLLRPFMAPLGPKLEGYIDQALRDFKAALEGKGQEDAIRRGPHFEPAQATGTLGNVNPRPTVNTRFGGPPSPVEYTRPPEAKS